MKSPVPDLAPSDGEEGEDRTPLLQRAPRAETGEQLREPGSSDERRSQGRGCPELLKREGTENAGPIQDPTQPPPSRVPRSSSGAQEAGWTVRPGRVGRRLGRDLCRRSPGDLGRCSPGGLGRCSRRARAGSCWALAALGSRRFSVVLSRGPCGRTNLGRILKSMGRGRRGGPRRRANWGEICN